MNYLRVVNKFNGFTLIEMLVVLVILGLTTTLLSEGLSNTWRNFERLGSRDMMANSAQLPINWFADSVDGAVLYHPFVPVVRGDAQNFEFISIKVPNDERHTPQTIRWTIDSNGQNWTLSFVSAFNEQPIRVKQFDTLPVFQYLYEGKWQMEFSPVDASLPNAVRINLANKVYLVAKPGRPVMADIPVELPIFGEYEF
jgi:general secretion pathway protein J